MTKELSYYDNQKSKAWGLSIDAFSYFPRFDSIVQKKFEPHGLVLKANGGISGSGKSFSIYSKDKKEIKLLDLVNIIGKEYIEKYKLNLHKRSDDWLKYKVPLEILINDWKKIHR